MSIIRTRNSIVQSDTFADDFGESLERLAKEAGDRFGGSAPPLARRS